MLKKRPRACEAIDVRPTFDGLQFDGGVQDTIDLATGRCIRLCWADGMEPIRNVVGFWRVYDMETGQPVTDPFESPLEAMLEYLQTRED